MRYEISSLVGFNRLFVPICFLNNTYDHLKGRFEIVIEATKVELDNVNVLEDLKKTFERCHVLIPSC